MGNGRRALPSGMDDKEDVLNKVANEELAEVLWGMVEELPGQQSEVGSSQKS